MRDLRRVIDRYGNTPAAERARRFRLYARARVLLEELEGRGPAEGRSALPERSTSEIERELEYLLQQLGKTRAGPRSGE